MKIVTIYFIIGGLLMSTGIILTIISSFMESGSQLARLATKITNVLQILLFAGILISYKSYDDNSKKSILATQSELTEKGWVQVYEKIQQFYDKCPHFCNSLSYPWQIPKNDYIKDPSIYSKEKDDYNAIITLALLIFQSMSYVLFYYMYYENNDYLDSWLRSFIIWSNSDVLYDIWKTNKLIYDGDTITFIDVIFKYVREKRPNNNNELVTLSTKICKSQELKDIFNSVDKKTPCE